MKKTVIFLLAALLCLVLVSCEKEPAETDGPGTDEPETDAPVSTVYAGPDFFVAANGSDDADGSEAHPFATPGKAFERVRELRGGGFDGNVTVTFSAGRYPVHSFLLEETNGGAEPDAPVIYRSAGDGDAIFDASFLLTADLFGPVTNESVAARLPEEVRENVLACDLGAAGLTSDMIGPRYGYGSAYRGPSDTKGTNVGLFWGDVRMTPARYPNSEDRFEEDDFLYIDEGSVISQNADGHGGTILLTGEAKEHADRWAVLDDAWAFGYFQFNWADETTKLLSYDSDTGAVTFLYPSYSGYREGAEFYFFDLPEELDAPGEYWIDRDSNVLYFLPPEGDAGAVSVNWWPETMFSGSLSNAVFEGLIFQGSRDGIIRLSGNHLTVRNCVLRNFETFGFQISGSDNTVYGCEIYNAGSGGCSLSGGNFDTLERGKNVIENNYLHDFSQVNRMYSGGIGVSGVGNSILHNEIEHSPHAGLSAGDLEHLLAWNYVHDIVQEADDAGAYYGGGQWQARGNVIEHNKFENIGNDHTSANAIYFDDMMSGMTARYNLIIDCRGFAFMCGGGRDHRIYNNVVINNVDGNYFYYDDRMRAHYLEQLESGVDGVWTNQESGMWAELNRYPWKSELWAERYPELAAITFDTSNIDDPNFPINPAGSVVKDNIFIGPWNKWKYQIWDSVYQFSEIGEYLYNENADRVFEPGTYELTKVGKRAKIDYTPIPYDGYGLYDDFVKR